MLISSRKSFVAGFILGVIAGWTTPKLLVLVIGIGVGMLGFTLGRAIG